MHEQYDCELCDYHSSSKYNYDKHVLTAKHQMMTNSLLLARNVAKKMQENYDCTFCDFRTSNKYNYDKHILTAKHQMMTKMQKNALAPTNVGGCICGKTYKFRQGLFNHRKECIYKADDPDQLCSEILNENNMVFDGKYNQSRTDESVGNTALPFDNIIVEIIKENQEFKHLLLEQQKENKELMNKMVEISQQQLCIPTTINHNTTNNNFNLNIFLNETCKDAMNIDDFISDIKITFEELLAIGDTGFVNGLSDIVVKRLRDMEITKRPIHCTDAKRETIYLKESDVWNKDSRENNQLKKIIERVEYKNVAALHNWCNENPDSRINNTPNNLLKDKIYLQTLQGDERTREKIIKNISKEIMIKIRDPQVPL